MRSFIAIKIDDQVIKRIKKLQQDLQVELENKISTGKKTRAAKWVNPDSMHLTLKFLGQIDDNQALAAAKVIENTTLSHNSFDINITGTGFFGKPGRVFWAGIKRSKQLLNLQQQLDADLAKAGFPPETREYKGHLTICRIKSTRFASALSKAAKDFENLDFGPSFVDSVGLYKSELTNAGPLYTLMSSSELK